MKQIDTLLIDLFMDLLANAENSGTCGPNLKWLLTDNGVLVITGKGGMYDYSDYNRSPWSKSDIKRIIIGDGVTTIGEFAFNDCSALTSVNILNSVTTIKMQAFSNCSALTSVNIPNSVTTIGNYAFADCSALTSVTIPNSVTEIGDGAFAGCRALTSVTIPNSVTTIRDLAFAHCSALTSVTIPNSVTTIRDLAFAHCSALTSVTIPNSVTEIGDYAFIFCIIEDFFKANPEILLYLCETGDGKQASRNRLFVRWFREYAKKSLYYFDTVAINAEGIENFAAIIVQKKNPKLNEILEVFNHVVNTLKNKP